MRTPNTCRPLAKLAARPRHLTHAAESNPHTPRISLSVGIYHHHDPDSEVELRVACKLSRREFKFQLSMSIVNTGPEKKLTSRPEGPSRHCSRSPKTPGPSFDHALHPPISQPTRPASALAGRSQPPKTRRRDFHLSARSVLVHFCEM